MDLPLTRSVPCRRFKQGRFTAIEDEMANEIRVTLHLPGQTRTLFAAPVDPVSLAVGHAALDMLPAGQVPDIVAADDLSFFLTARPDERGSADISLPRPQTPAALLALMTRFIAAPGLWDGTGCFHRAGLYDTVVEDFVVRAEDIGRHNCLDRLAGYGVTQGLRLPEHILFLSCRVTASMMEKALRAGVRMVVSRSAVTGAALESAREAAATLIGFARDAEARFTVFADSAGRVLP